MALLDHTRDGLTEFVAQQGGSVMAWLTSGENGFGGPIASALGDGLATRI